MFTSVKNVSYRVSNLEKAKEWYSQVLGKEPAVDAPFSVIFIIGDSALTLYPCSELSEPADERVVAYWNVEDFDKAVEKIISLGGVQNDERKTVFNSRIVKLTDPFGNVIGITGKDTPDKTVQNRPSDSAMTVTFCRALAAKEERKEIRGSDNIAEIFLSKEGMKLINDRASREWIINKLTTPELYFYFFARTAHLDNVFKCGLMNCIPQIVLLGAGYDTRPYRFSDLIKSTMIFEVDSHLTQQRKKEILYAEKITIPQNHVFLAVDFLNDKLENCLPAAGYNKNQKTLFIMEGVSYYLPLTAMETTLEFIINNSGQGSILHFDYMTERKESPYPGEPFLFWISEDKVNSFLEERGFEVVSNSNSEKITESFLKLENGSYAGKTLSSFSFIEAAVK